MSITYSPIVNSSGRVIGASAIARDVANRKHAHAINAQLAAIVDSCDDAVISLTLAGQIESWNRGAERIYGYTAEETVGRDIALLLAPDCYDEVPAIRARLALGERIGHYETVFQRKDGSLIDVSVTLSPVVNSSGRVIGASSVSRDVTEHKKAETIAAHLAAIVDSADDGVPRTWRGLPV